MSSDVTNHPSKVRILLVDDDPDDRYLIQSAFEENNLVCHLTFIEDSSKVFDFLHQQIKSQQLPNLILLDLNMPKKGGQQVLQEIKNTPQFCHIPVIIFTTSKSPDDVRNAYTHGASSFVTKPSSFEQLLEVTRNMGHYWLHTSILI